MLYLLAKEYSEPCVTYKMGLNAEIVSGRQPSKTLHLRCLTDPWVRHWVGCVLGNFSGFPAIHIWKISECSRQSIRGRVFFKMSQGSPPRNSRNISIFFFIWTLTTPCISESCIKVKINLNFYFLTSFWCLKRFYKCKAFVKPFEAPQRSVKIRI